MTEKQSSVCKKHKQYEAQRSDCDEGLISSSTLDIYRLVRVSLVQRYSANPLNATFKDARAAVANLFERSNFTLAPALV